jgi:hypothetical protein
MSEIALLGDIAFNGIISSQPEKNHDRFKQISLFLKGVDFVFANLEVPVNVDDEYNENKKILRYANKEVTKDLLQRLNIGCVSLANNHIYDCKMSGLEATINLLDESGIFHTGAGWKKEHIEPAIIDRAGVKIGFMAYVDRDTNPKTEDFPELLINYLEPEKVIADIIYLRNRVDKIICSIHWGTGYSNFFTKKQQKLARTLINEGIDIITGHHPHTIQPYEVFNGKYIFYSLGQLCFGDIMWEGELRALRRKTKPGIIPIIDSKGILKSIIPTRERKGNYVEISNINITGKLKFLSKINGLILKNLFFKYIIVIKESFTDRLYEFCFGYYRNPFKEIMKLKNYKKGAYIIRDFRSMG